MKYLNWSFLKTGMAVLVIFLAFNTVSLGQTTAVTTDRALVQAAVEDYVLALYDVEPERIERSVHKRLHKIGYYDHNGNEYNHIPMTFQQLYDLSGTWNKSGDNANADSPQIIDIYEVHDKTASAKLTAEWGIDFMHLSKVNGKWKIMNIMWQSGPK